MHFKPNPAPFHLSLGKRGETFAWTFLKEKGYKILEKNYRCKAGEMDVVARRDGRLRFVEIKTRRGHGRGRPEEAVEARKQRKLIQVAQWYLKQRKVGEVPISFDVVALTWDGARTPQIKLIQDAFEDEFSL